MKRTTSDPIRSLVAEIEAFRSAIRAAEGALEARPSVDVARLEKLVQNLRRDIERLEEKLGSARADRDRSKK